MSCRHDLANGTCVRCYPGNPSKREDKDRVDPGPEENYQPNLEGPGAMPTAARTVVALTDGRFAVAVVQEGVAGYSVDMTKTTSTWHAAQILADMDNKAAGVTREEAWRIAQSSMNASRTAGIRWGPR
jgi:hypothetical protein